MTHVTTGHRTCEEPGRNSRSGCPRGIRLAAIGVMAACAVLHLVSLAVAPPASGLATLLLLGMTYACVPCATRAAMAPTRRTWLHAGAVSIAMLVAHPVLGLLSSGHAMHAHVAAGSAAITFGLTLGPLLSLCLSGYAAWVTSAAA